LPQRARVVRDATEALVTQHEQLSAIGSAAVLAALDLGVGAAQADAHDIDLDIAGHRRRVGHVPDRA